MTTEVGQLLRDLLRPYKKKFPRRDQYYIKKIFPIHLIQSERRKRDYLEIMFTNFVAREKLFSPRDTVKIYVTSDTHTVSAR